MIEVSLRRRERTVYKRGKYPPRHSLFEVRLEDLYPDAKGTGTSAYAALDSYRMEYLRHQMVTRIKFKNQ